jgi:hypothetical protein
MPTSISNKSLGGLDGLPLQGSHRLTVDARRKLIRCCPVPHPKTAECPQEPIGFICSADRAGDPVLRDTCHQSLFIAVRSHAQRRCHLEIGCTVPGLAQSLWGCVLRMCVQISSLRWRWDDTAERAGEISDRWAPYSGEGGRYCCSLAVAFAIWDQRSESGVTVLGT